MNDSGINEDGPSRVSDRKINGRSGGALLIWIGFSFLVDIGWGISAVGVGVILLVEQYARWSRHINFQKFWVLAGAVLVGVGAATTIGLREALVPVLLLITGIVMVANTFRDRQ